MVDAPEKLPNQKGKIPSFHRLSEHPRRQTKRAGRKYKQPESKTGNTDSLTNPTKKQRLKNELKRKLLHVWS
jgi:hypothetical protein